MWTTEDHTVAACHSLTSKATISNRRCLVWDMHVEAGTELGLVVVWMLPWRQSFGQAGPADGRTAVATLQWKASLGTSTRLDFLLPEILELIIRLWYVEVFRPNADWLLIGGPTEGDRSGSRYLCRKTW
jgi:hypothetical protein